MTLRFTHEFLLIFIFCSFQFLFQANRTPLDKALFKVTPALQAADEESFMTKFLFSRFFSFLGYESSYFFRVAILYARKYR